MRHFARVLFVLSAIAGTVTLGACLPDFNASSRTIRIGVLPDQNSEALKVRYAPLMKHLSDVTGQKVQLVIPDSYDDLVEKFGAIEVDIAYFGGVTFVRANKTQGAEPLVMRDVDATFKSYFIAHRSTDDRRGLAQFKGTRFAFGSKSSTSGHLMPRHFMIQKGLEPERAFSYVVYSRGHDDTVRKVASSEATLGAVNALIYESMVEKDASLKNVTRIVWVTPPYPDYVWAARKGLSRDIKDRFQNAFLSLSGTNPNDQKVLNSLNAGGFLPAKMENFAVLKTIMRVTGL